MRYYVEKDCCDFGGRFFKGGLEVDLPEGNHSRYLRPIGAPEPAPVAEAAEAPADTGETAAPKKTRKKAATTTVAEG